MSALSVRLAEPTTADIETVAGLLVEMDRYHGRDEPAPLAAYILHVEQRLLGLGSATLVGVAEQFGQTIGLALFSPVIAGLRQGGVVFVKNVFVLESARNRGAGTALLKRAAEVGADLGCMRMDFSVHLSSPARRLYDRLGGAGDPARAYYLIEGEAFRALAGVQ